MKTYTARTGLEIVEKATLRRYHLAVAQAYKYSEEHKRRIALKKLLRNLGVK